MDKKLYWSLRITLGILAIIALYQVVPSLIASLGFLVDLYKLSDKSHEFKLMLVAISIYVNCTVINMIVNFVSKMHGLLEDKLIKGENNHANNKNR